jgi:uncharacterized membrane protein
MERHTTAHLWAVGYDDINRAGQVREVIVSLANAQRYLQLLDIGVLARSHDGSLTLNGERLSTAGSVATHGILGLLAGFALAVPLLSSDAVARAFDSPAPEKSESLGIDETFKREIASMMQPASSALLVLDIAQNMNAILPRLEGLGGRILKTNVDIERANLIQRALARKMTP